MVIVRFFAGFREKMGKDQIEVSLNGKTSLKDFLGKLEAGYPEIEALLKKGMATVAVNHEVVAPDHLLMEGDEVALFPPVSGG